MSNAASSAVLKGGCGRAQTAAAGTAGSRRLAGTAKTTQARGTDGRGRLLGGPDIHWGEMGRAVAGARSPKVTRERGSQACPGAGFLRAQPGALGLGRSRTAWGAARPRRVCWMQ